MNIYTLTDAAGAPHQLISGQLVITQQQRIDTAEESAYALGAEIGSYVPCVSQIRYTDLDGYDDVLLARWKITRTVVADPPPPPPPRAQLPKSTVMARVFALGFEPQVAALFAASFALQSKWFSPDWPNVYCDDADLLTALHAIGMSADQIAQATAP